MSITVIDRAAESFANLRKRFAAVAGVVGRYNRDSHAKESLYLWKENHCVVHLIHETYDPHAEDDPPTDGFPALIFTHQDGWEHYSALEISTPTTKASLVWQSDNGASLTTEEVFELILSTYEIQSERDPAELVDII